MKRLCGFLMVILLAGCAPEKTWTPMDIDPSFHLFYLSPVSQAVEVNGKKIPAWDGERSHQVEIYECSDTQARISGGENPIWVERSILLADWCDTETFKQVKQ